MSSRNFAAAAIMARAESFTELGGWPSAQLIDASAEAFEFAARDHFQKDMKSSTKRPRMGPSAGPVGAPSGGGPTALGFPCPPNPLMKAKQRNSSTHYCKETPLVAPRERKPRRCRYKDK